MLGWDALTDSAPETAGVADPSFFCFDFAFAKELNRSLFSLFNGAVFSLGLTGGFSSAFVCDVIAACSAFLFSDFTFCVASSCDGRFEGAAASWAGVGAGGEGRTPVLL